MSIADADGHNILMSRRWDINKRSVWVSLQFKLTKFAVQEQQAVSRVTIESTVHLSSKQRRLSLTFTTVLPSALFHIYTVTQWDVSPSPRYYRGVPVIAVSPRLPRYSHRPHYRADLYYQ